MDDKELEDIKKIQELTKEDLQSLFNLIPEIKNTKTFYKEKPKLNDGKTIEMRYPEEAEVVWKFHDLVYKIPIIISFDWPSWEEGREIINDDDYDFNSLDIVAICKLITAIVRNERFCEGALLSAFRNGTMLKLLLAIESKF